MMQGNFTQYALDNMSEMILCFDDRGCISYGNKAAEKLLEFEEDLLGTHISEIFPNEFQKTADGFQANIAFGSSAVHEIMAYRMNRTCFLVEAKFSEMNEDFEYICLMKDVSNVKYLEKRVKQVEQDAEDALKVKSEFVANVTHELRTPVNGILGNTRELISRVEDEGCQRILDLMERGCNDMHALINNILDFSKLEAGKFTLEKREFDFRKMLDYVKGNHIHKITEKGLQFFMTISPEVPTSVIGDELRIVQVLNNLLSNATKFTSVGKIAVEIVKTAQMDNRAELFFLVTDTGVGIAKENLDKLFKSFSQVDASISRKYGGTGLGLNISKQLVEMMGGTISVQSELGKGTIFSFSVWVELPEAEQKENMVTIDRNALLTDAMQRSEEDGHLKEFGSEENKAELEKNLSKLILCVEMENWEKAETFMTAVKQLTEAAPQEIRTGALRLKMAVQKGDYEKTSTAYNELLKLL
ncbi:MAG: PAS domain-containing protein [Agathobacter sp.]|nr:PAS domain-containing protein [Agathobacter sp.]